MVIAGFQGTFRSTGYGRHLLIGHFFKILQVKDQSLFVRQGEEGFLQPPLNLITIYMWCVVNLRGERGTNILDGQEEPSSFTAQERQRFVGGNPVNPGEQLGIFAEVVDGLVNFDEYLLGNVVGIVVVNDHFSHNAIYLLLVSPHEHIEPITPGVRLADLA